jgi:hypothetical protein
LPRGRGELLATGARGRIINSHETHNECSHEGYRGGGSRGKSEANSQFRTRRETRRVKLKAYRRCTAPRTSAGEVIPSFYIFDTSAEVEADKRFSLA